MVLYPQEKLSITVALIQPEVVHPVTITVSIHCFVKNVTSGVLKKIDGADFTDALLDRSQQKALCERASGKTAESLKCGSLSSSYVPASEGQNKFNPGT